MKNILITLSVILITLASCTNNPITQKDSGEQYMGVITDKINEHNKYWVDNGYEDDTMSFVGVDTIITIKNTALFNRDNDTSKIKIIGHTNTTLVFVTVKMYSKGYYSKETLVFHFNSSNPSVYMQTPDLDYETMTYTPIKLTDVVSLYRKDENLALREYKESIQSYNESKNK